MTGTAAAERLVYGTLTDVDALVFIPEREATELATLHGALRDAKTWGELKARIPPKRWHEAIAVARGEDDPAPADEDAFEFQGEDWPEWTAQRMLEWMPADIQDRFGKREASRVSGDALVIDPAVEPQLVAALANAGYICRRDDALVARASGY